LCLSVKSPLRLYSRLFDYVFLLAVSLLRLWPCFRSISCSHRRLSVSCRGCRPLLVLLTLELTVLLVLLPFFVSYFSCTSCPCFGLLIRRLLCRFALFVWLASVRYDYITTVPPALPSPFFDTASIST